VAVHGDEEGTLKEKSYTRFLCSNPFLPATQGTVPLGAFHVEYRIDGFVIISSVLFFGLFAHLISEQTQTSGNGGCGGSAAKLSLLRVLFLRSGLCIPVSGRGLRCV
jgi:hypothetical protein